MKSILFAKFAARSSWLAGLGLGLVTTLGGCPEALDVNINNPQANLFLSGGSATNNNDNNDSEAAIGEQDDADAHSDPSSSDAHAAPVHEDDASGDSKVPDMDDGHSGLVHDDPNAPSESSSDPNAHGTPEPNTPHAPEEVKAPIGGGGGGCGSGHYVGNLDGIQAQAALQFEVVRPDAISETIYVGGQVLSPVASYLFKVDIRNGQTGWGEMIDESSGETFQIQIDLFTEGFLLTANPFGPGPTQYAFTCQ